MANFNVGDVVRYFSRSAQAHIEATVEKVRDTQTDPLKNGEAPPSQFLLTLTYVDPLKGTCYVNVYSHRVEKMDSPAGWNYV